MKSTKKLLALLLSAILLLSLLPAAFATEPGGTGTTDAEANPTTDTQKFHLTITGTYPKHVFELYQVFTGTLHTETIQTDAGETTTRYLSDIAFGSAWGDTTGKDISTIVEKFKTNVENNWNVLFGENGGSANVYATKTCADGETTVTFSDLPAGYYIAREITPLQDMGDGVTYSSVIVQVVENVSVASKHGTATSQKKVMDTNDSTGDTTGWQDSADYDIGDMVPFQLTATVGSDYAKYSKERGYSLTFHDHESKGLTFESTSVKAYVVNGSETPVVIDTAQYVVSTPTASADGGHDFTIKFANLKNIADVKAGSKIVVEYKSRLNEGAAIGSKGNPNEMYITFSNNPNSDQLEEGGMTPDVKVIVFTYRLDVFKKDGTQADAADHAPLPGATFALYKKVNANDDYTKEIGTIESKNAEHGGTIFRFTGLDDGDYKLVEVKAPDGYNTAEDVYFTITANHEADSSNPKLINLGCKYRSGQTGTANEITGSVSGLNDGSILIDVLNYRGNTLPSTGGMGTTVFYVLGSILAVGAAILLVSKKRMNGAR